jgi:hypothetical protein
MTCEPNHPLRILRRKEESDVATLGGSADDPILHAGNKGESRRADARRA